MGQHAKYRALVKTALLAGLCLAAGPAEACRLALVLALDVSSSVDDAEDRLQRDGLAAALLAPEVQDAFLAGPDPVSLLVFEWSGRAHQTTLADWQVIATPADLQDAARQVRDSQRTAHMLPTALGHALGYAALQFERASDCLFQTVDVAGDGVNNTGFGPAGAYATFPYEGVVVNGLVITGDDPAAVDYFTNNVIRGPASFVEVADGFTDFEAAMRRKLVRELTAQVIGHLQADEGPQG